MREQKKLWQKDERTKEQTNQRMEWQTTQILFSPPPLFKGGL